MTLVSSDMASGEMTFGLDLNSYLYMVDEAKTNRDLCVI